MTPLSRHQRRLAGSAFVAVACCLLTTACQQKATSAGPQTSTSAAPSAVVSATISAPPVSTTYPLTGLPLRAGEKPESIIAVKIDNIAPARPQYGLNDADLVIEEPVEGGLTRLMAVYSSKSPTRVEPVRSARIPDGHVLHALGGGALAYSGASAAQNAWLHGQPGYALWEYDASSAWARDSNRSAPHNLKVDVAALRQTKGKALNYPPQTQFGFSDQTTAGGTPTKQASMSWTASSAGWNWNQAKGVWLRTQGGTVDKLATGQQVSATNVVILNVKVDYNGAYRDVNGNPTPMTNFDAGGKGWLLRGGQRVAGTWSRSGEKGAFMLTAADGTKITLQPGRTWIELLPQGRNPKFS